MIPHMSLEVLVEYKRLLSNGTYKIPKQSRTWTLKYSKKSPHSSNTHNRIVDSFNQYTNYISYTNIGNYEILNSTIIKFYEEDDLYIYKINLYDKKPNSIIDSILDFFNVPFNKWFFDPKEVLRKQVTLRLPKDCYIQILRDIKLSLIDDK